MPTGTVVRELIREAEVNIDYYYTIKISGNQQYRYIRTGTHGNNNFDDIDLNVIKSELTKAEEACTKTCLSPAEIVSQAEVISQAYLMTKKQKEYYESSIDKLLELSKETDIGPHIKENLEIKFWYYR